MLNASLLLGFIAFLMSTPVNTVEAESPSASTPAEALVTPAPAHSAPAHSASAHSAPAEAESSSVLGDCSVSAPAHSASAAASVPVVSAGAVGFSAEDLVSSSCLDSASAHSAPAEASASEDANVVSSVSPLPVSAPSAASASGVIDLVADSASASVDADVISSASPSSVLPAELISESLPAEASVDVNSSAEADSLALPSAPASPSSAPMNSAVIPWNSQFQFKDIVNGRQACQNLVHECLEVSSQGYVIDAMRWTWALVLFDWIKKNMMMRITDLNTMYFCLQVLWCGEVIVPDYLWDSYDNDFCSLCDEIPKIPRGARRDVKTNNSRLNIFCEIVLVWNSLDEDVQKGLLRDPKTLVTGISTLKDWGTNLFNLVPNEKQRPLVIPFAEIELPKPSKRKTKFLTDQSVDPPAAAEKRKRNSFSSVASSSSSTTATKRTFNLRSAKVNASKESRPSYSQPPRKTRRTARNRSAASRGSKRSSPPSSPSPPPSSPEPITRRTSSRSVSSQVLESSSEASAPASPIADSDSASSSLPSPAEDPVTPNSAPQAEDTIQENASNAAEDDLAAVSAPESPKIVQAAAEIIPEDSSPTATPAISEMTRKTSEDESSYESLDRPRRLLRECASPKSEELEQAFKWFDETKGNLSRDSLKKVFRSIVETQEFYRN